MDEEPKTDGEFPETTPTEEPAPTAPENTADAVPGDTPEATAEVAEEIEANGVVYRPITGERVLDIVLGMAVLTGEALDRAAQQFLDSARQWPEQAPVFAEIAESRGRAFRHNLFGIESDTAVTPSSGIDTALPVLRSEDTEAVGAEPIAASDENGGEITAPAANGTANGAAVTAPPSPAASVIAGSLRNIGTSLGLLSGGRQSAEDEIRSLENRVRELEQFVTSPGTTAPAVEEASSTSSPYDLDSSPEEVTTADSATYVPGDHGADDALAGSPYAVSETTEEQAIEGQSTGDTPEAPSPSPKASRKKQKEFDPEPTDDNAPPT